MRRVDGGDDFELPKTDEVHGLDDLRMFDAGTAIAGAVGFQYGFEDVESNAIGAVADGVEIELEAGLVPFDSHDAQFFWIVNEDSGGGRIVGIWLQHCGRARTECSIRDGFERTGLQPGILGAALCLHILQFIERQIEWQPLRDAHGKFAFLFELLVNLKILPSRIVLDGSDSILGDVLQDQFDSAAALLRRGIGNPHSNQRHRRVFFQHACGFTERIMLNLAPRRIRSAFDDLRTLERERIRDCNVTGDMCEDHGVPGRDGIELLAIGKSFLRPGGVVPPAASNPFTRFVMRDSVGDTFRHLSRRRYAHQRDCKLICCGNAQMYVSVIEAGHHELAPEIEGVNAFLAAPTIRQHVVHLANASDSPLACRHGLGPRMLRAIGINAAVGVIRRALPFLCRARFRVIWQKVSSSKNRENPEKELNTLRSGLHPALSSPTPEIPNIVRSARFIPVSRPAESYHSCSECAPPPLPPPPMEMASIPCDSGLFASAEDRSMRDSLPTISSAARSAAKI